MKKAFTLVELLVVSAVIGILAALLLPALSRAKARAHRVTCVNNLKQISYAVMTYAHDHQDRLPFVPEPSSYPNGTFFFFKELVKGYVGYSGPPKEGEKLFVCPAERMGPTDGLPSQGYIVDYSDYFMPTIGKLSAIRHPTRTVLVGEYPACVGYSWHEPQRKYYLVDNFPGAPTYLHNAYSNAMNEMSFADGHINWTKIYNDGKWISAAYNPPAGYDYQWSVD
jgi:prepilin-type N-terminal cleavage/methylation domain-containing protein